jgi:hypothetical protein
MFVCPYKLQFSAFRNIAPLSYSQGKCQRQAIQNIQGVGLGIVSFIRDPIIKHLMPESLTFLIKSPVP